MKSTTALLVVACGLSFADGLLRLTYTGRSSPEGSWPWLFNATSEHSLPTWFSIAAMAWLGVACLRNLPRHANLLVGAGFLYLAVDDALMVHERVGELVMPWVAGVGVYSWIAVLMPIYAIGGLYAAWQLWQAQPDRRARLLLLAGMGVLALAMAIEAMESRTEGSGLRLRGLPLVDYTKWVEESLEMLGPVLLMMAVPRHARSDRAAP